MKLLKDEIEFLKERYKQKDYEFQEINTFGGLNMRDLDKDVFNDITGWFTDSEGEMYQSTLNPSKQSLLKGGMNGTGAPFLVLKQHKNMDCIDIHGMRVIESLCNREKNRFSDGRYAGCCAQTIQRDFNRDMSLYGEKTQIGYFGMNCHPASTKRKVETIGVYGEGCWVTLNYQDHLQHMGAVKSTSMYLQYSGVTLFHRTGFDYKELIDMYNRFYKEA